MEDVLILSGSRTPIGDFGGAFKELLPNELALYPVKEAVARAGVNKSEFDEVILGNCIQRTDEPNVARVVLLKAGFPKEVTGYTIQRQCSSGMQAIVSGIQQIRLGDSDLVAAGGVECMSSSPYSLKNARWGQRLQHGEVRDSVWEVLCDPTNHIMMGQTAENLAIKYDITREEQDAIALRSHQKAIAAIKSGRFKDEVVPVTITVKKNGRVIDTDERPKDGLSMADLAKLRPAFCENGTVTAGNSSGINDGAAAVVLASERKVRELNAKPLARIVSYAVAGVEPELMGYGPVPAVKKALQKANLTIGDIDLWEVNEAFAAQYLAVEKMLGLNRSVVNVNGSGVGLGHPIGCTGARIVVTLLYELKRRNLRYGLATLCVGGGMGKAIIIEAV
ncbi:thiolase family protein [Phosphitispora fastidiosa]|uniref:thiolase family protein n=1 Tax=Phosphitispora fastidiosa TaxID=2837202 RepID=UPI001E35496E|nr:acetyl-CoA C-acetyltransferase [Phosphitispora fastidiosa]MBU7006778.1 acetyl-CoA C-acetyltransferase [Phosphitispora fastidiosa]